MRYVRRFVLLVVLSMAAALAIEGVFHDSDITTGSGRYAWSAAIVIAAGAVFFLCDFILDEMRL